MKKGCLLTLVPLLACCGCNDINSPLALKPQQKPIAPKPAEPAPAPAEASAPQAAPEPVDGSTAEAVRQFLADLDAAGAEPGAAQEPPAYVEAPPLDSARTTRANEALTLADEPAQTAAHHPGPALPAVLAVSLVGDTSLAAAAEETPTVGVHTGLDTAVPEGEVSLDRLIEKAKEELAGEPASAEKQWRLSLLQLAAGRPQDAAELSPGLAEEARTLTERTLKALTATSRALLEPAAGWEEALSAVNALRDVLRTSADLSVPVVALCTKVTTFGVYEEMPAEALLPYQANRVIVYSEIANFTTEDAGPQGRHALLATRLELFTADGRSLWTHEEERIEDYSKHGREDFFLAQLVTFPADLGPGEYVLKVAVTDALAAKTNEGVLRFSIGGEENDAITSAARP